MRGGLWVLAREKGGEARKGSKKRVGSIDCCFGGLAWGGGVYGK